MKEENVHENFLMQEQKPNKMRLWWLKTILMLGIVALSVVILFTLGKYVTGEETRQLTIKELLHTVNYPLIALLFGVILLYIFTESGKYSWMFKVYTGKFRFRTAVKTMFLGKYYDGITPLSTGGQPFQIFYLHKKDIPKGVASAIPIMKYIVSIIFLSLLAVVLLALTPRFVPKTTVNTTVLILSWISLVINISVPATLAVFSIFPKFGKCIVVKVVRLLARLRIVKHRVGVTKKFVREVTEYSTVFRQFARMLVKFIPLIFLCILESLLFVTIPFFIVIAVANVPPSFPLLMQIACLTIVSRYAALLIPTPGNAGALEAASSIVFATVAGIESVIGWTILTWRFFTYYVYILSGIGINIFEIIRSAVRTHRAMKK